MKEKVNILEKISHKNLVKIFIASIIIAIVYSLCFNYGSPQAALIIFSTVAIITVYFVMKSIDVKINKKALFWIIPIQVIALSSLFFYSNDVLSTHIVLLLLIVYTVSLMNFNFTRYITLELFNQLLQVMGYDTKTTNMFKALQSKSKNTNFIKILIGIAISLPVLVLIGGLLMSADDVFKSFYHDLLDIDIISISHMFLFVIALPVTYFILVKSKLTSEIEFKELKKIKFDKTIFITFLVSINLIFVLFCISQISFIIFKDGLSTLPEGFTYSEYVREGFFQLLFVSAINFIIILVFINFMDELYKNRVIKILLLMLSFFTVLLVLISLQRLILYIDAYGFTKLRMQVLIFLIFNLVLLIFTVIKLVKLNLNINTFTTVIILLGIITNAYIGNGYVAAMLNDKFDLTEDIESFNRDYNNYYSCNSEDEDRYAKSKPWQIVTLHDLVGKCK